jgi:hypothetical protein
MCKLQINKVIYCKLPARRGAQYVSFFGTRCSLRKVLSMWNVFWARVCSIIYFESEVVIMLYVAKWGVYHAMWCACWARRFCFWVRCSFIECSFFEVTVMIDACDKVLDPKCLQYEVLVEQDMFCWARCLLTEVYNEWGVDRASCLLSVLFV